MAAHPPIGESSAKATASISIYKCSSSCDAIEYISAIHMCLHPMPVHPNTDTPHAHILHQTATSIWLACGVKITGNGKWTHSHRGDSKLNIILYASSSDGGGALVCVASATSTAVDRAEHVCVLVCCRAPTCVTLVRTQQRVANILIESERAFVPY